MRSMMSGGCGWRAEVEGGAFVAFIKKRKKRDSSNSGCSAWPCHPERSSGCSWALDSESTQTPKPDLHRLVYRPNSNSDADWIQNPGPKLAATSGDERNKVLHNNAPPPA
ncbi:hypothetical protein M0R45_015327 [Rubus argutus]|uniref:Uncharacterized protein n=1 Tax=Rubus argutus TaxID=59490 RepID=A0AAW1XQG1_RUBAR